MMKRKLRSLVAPCAALAALCAFPLAASAANETTAPPDSTGCCEEYLFGSLSRTDYSDWADRCLYFDTLKSGDVDENGSLQIADAVMLARYIAEDGDVNLSASAKLLADPNMDGTIDAEDLALLLKGLCCSERYFLISFRTDETGVPYTVEGTTDPNGSIITTTTTTTTAYYGSGPRDENDWEGTIYIWNIRNENVKTIYDIGEELDLSNMLVAGYGRYGQINWDMFPMEGQHYLTDLLDTIEVDASEFDSTKPGFYTIYLHQRDTRGKEDSFPADGSFHVLVTPDGKTDGYIAIANIGMTNEESIGRFHVPAPKTVYRIGEKLDLSNMVLEGCGSYGDCDWDYFPDEYQQFLDQSLKYITVDKSEFDSTKPGTYTIYLYLYEMNIRIASGSFTVTVVPGEPTEGTQTDSLESTRGELTIFNLDMTDEESMDQFRVPAPKTIYRVGEALDLSNLVFIGNGVISTSDRYEYWDIFPPQILGQAPDYDKNIKVDSSEFDSTKPGTYTIYLHLYENNTDMKIASGSFQVTVIPDEPTEGTQLTEYDDGWKTCTTDSWGGYWLENDTWKDTYCIGEELDIEGLLNAPLYGCGTFYEPDGMGGYTQVYWDAFGEETLGERIKSGRMTLDTSAFDNTKPGIYTITFYDETASGSVEVRVISDKAAAPLPRVKKDF